MCILGCGGILKDLHGVISPPYDEFEDSYPPDLKCTWMIVAPPGYIIQINWVSFHLESHSRCAMDYVLLYEKTPDTGSEIGR